MPFQVVADGVLLLHFGVVVFVVCGLPAIFVGNWRGWSWVNHRGWRLAHLAAIAVVALQAVLGQYCALTTLESALRQKAGQAAYDRSFIEHWLSLLIYYEAPPWVFTLFYIAFGLLVVWAWWRFPPTRGRAEGDAS